MEHHSNKNVTLNNIYNQYIISASELDETDPDKYACMCGWLDKHNQHKRFELLLAKVKKNDRVLDIGCGGGEMVKYINENKLKVSYVGIDVNPNYLKIATLRYPKSKFEESNGWNLAPNNYDWAVASGIFTVEVDVTYLLWYVAYVMDRLVSKGFAFNLLTNNPYEGLINYEPDEVLVLLQERFPDYKIEIITGYLPDDFTVYVTK